MSRQPTQNGGPTAPDVLLRVDGMLDDEERQIRIRCARW